TLSDDASAALARDVGSDSHAGWCAAHTCVTAAAATLGIAPTMGSYLCSTQTAGGSWAGYWWDDDEYATAWAVEALSAPAANAASVRAAVSWCCGDRKSVV